MNPVPAIVAEEVELLADVRSRLDRARPRELASEDDLVAELKRIQEDVATAKTEDKPALEQAYERYVHLLEQLRRGRQGAPVDPANPYFAHLRVDQEGRRSDILLGRATCLQDGLRIVDWRHAPVSRLYYRYAEDDEYEEQFGERTRVGRILARRTVAVKDGRLDRVSAPQGTWWRHGEVWTHLQGETPVFAARGHFSKGNALRADKHLPDIAALIDPDQFELIARPDSGPVVIRGGAGSGKTTVALHRIAWLAYQHPHRFAPHRMLVVVWGKALRDYVSNVLPALGVAGVPVTTWSTWARKLVARHFPYLPAHDNANTPAVASRIKLHPGLPSLLAEVVRTRAAAPNGHSAYEDWKLLLSDGALLGRLHGVSDAEIAEHLLWTRAQQAQLAAMEEREKGAEPWLDEEDDAILLRAWQLRAGPFRAPGGGHVKLTHVAVDEVQDFAAMEVAVLLGCLDEKRCITLAGDTQQHILESGGSERWGDLLGGLGIPATSLSTLRVSYRSTGPITRFARALLGPLTEDDVAPDTMRDGPPVERMAFSDHGACVEMLGRSLLELMAAEPLASVAVVARDMATARMYHQGLEHMEVPRLRLVEDQTFAFAPGIDVVDVAQVKGLEFDYVVIVDASAAGWPDRPALRRQLHVAATRAVHQLWVTYVGEPSPILPPEGTP